MKKALLLVLSLILAGNMLACASRSSDTKVVSAQGVSFSVPNSWGEFEDTSDQEYMVLQVPASASKLKIGEVSLIVLLANSDTNVTFDEAIKRYENEPEARTQVVNINGTDFIRVDTYAGGSTVIMLVPNTGSTVNILITVSVLQTEYIANTDLYESIVSSITVK